MAVDRTLDVKGLYCPEPIMLLHAEIAQMQQGEIVKVIATDPSTRRDIPKFCQFLKHELVAKEQAESDYIYFIRKT